MRALAVLLYYIAISSAQSTSPSRVKKEIALAKQNGQSEVHLPAPHRDLPRLKTLGELLYRHIPLLVRVVACRAAVHPISRDSVITYCVLAVENNILEESLPTQLPSSTPGDIRSLIPEKGSYIVTLLAGGSTTVDGIKVSMKPEQHDFQTGREYLVFVHFSPNGLAFLFADDRGALAIDTAAGQKLTPAKETVPIALRALRNLDLDKAVSVIKYATPVP